MTGIYHYHGEPNHVQWILEALAATAAAGRENPELRVEQSGDASVQKAVEESIADDFAKAVAVDSAGYAYVTGYTASTNFPTTSAPRLSYGILLSTRCRPSPRRWSG